jgi:DNA-binding transcriptional regulator YdaS (Cro superfamily)
MKELIERAAKAAGSQSKLAEALGVTQQNVSYWKSSGIPMEYGAAVEVATQGAVTRKEMWPDSWHKYWPELAQSPADCMQAATKNVAVGYDESVRRDVQAVISGLICSDPKSVPSGGG